MVFYPGKPPHAGVLMTEASGHRAAFFCGCVDDTLFLPQLTGLSESTRMEYLTSSILVMQGHLCKQKHCFPTATCWLEVRIAFSLCLENSFIRCLLKRIPFRVPLLKSHWLLLPLQPILAHLLAVWNLTWHLKSHRGNHLMGLDTTESPRETD